MGYRKHYANDPRRITARFASNCAGCEGAIHKGNSIFYYPSTRAAYGSRCGCADSRAREFEAQASDDDLAPAVW